MTQTNPCHQCGLPIHYAITWSSARGERHVFCDNDCLARWLEDRITLAHAETNHCLEELADGRGE
jgi:hypothetical protein